MADINFDEVYRQVEQGYITARKHIDFPLTIFNYTIKAQMEWHWTPETVACRGLIIDHRTHDIIARPFPKFFNLRSIEDLPNEPFEVFDKLDGSLGIIYHWFGRAYAATRGGFDGPQARLGNNILWVKYPDIALCRKELDPTLTYLVEIIHPSNRIIVNYGRTVDLFHLATIETATAKERPLESIGLPVVRRFDGLDLESVISMQDPKREGFVLRFQSGFRVKVKFEEYKELHHLMLGLTARTIWESLKAGKDIHDETIAKMPLRFQKWAMDIKRNILTNYAAIEAEAKAAFHYDTSLTRPQIAEQFKRNKYAGILFRMLDGYDYSEMIWKLVYPKHERPYDLNDEQVDL